jgi:hypothetical protein
MAGVGSKLGDYSKLGEDSALFSLFGRTDPGHER